MRILLDTHIVLSLLRKDALSRFPMIVELLSQSETSGFVSIATLREVAIKTRLGKLDPGMPLEDVVFAVENIGLDLLQIDVKHMISTPNPEPSTRDPFDRLLLAQCQIEGRRLATVDGGLVSHPAALRMSTH